MIYDVIIVGAGASGLACADVLVQNRKKILLLEARDVVGGRAVSFAGSQGAVDVGAEFIHGYPDVTVQYAREFGLHFYDVSDKRFSFQEGRLRSSRHFWDQMQKYADKMKRSKRSDQSIQEFLNSQRQTDVLKLFGSYIEGFHAADLNLIGERGFLSANETKEDDELNGDSLFRFKDGYSHFWKQFLSPHKKIAPALRLKNVVKEIDFSKKTVIVKALAGGAPVTYHAKKVVVSVSIGVLKSSVETQSHIHWLPAPPRELETFLKAVEIGHIQKVTFQFKNRFWEGLRDEKMSFFHDSPKSYFPTWWNFLPMRSPYLVAWQGGPKALEMAAWPAQLVGEKALQTLAKLTKRNSRFLKQQFEAQFYHNWSTDPYFLGAYSYIRTHGLSGSKALHRSSNDRVFFIGEGTETNSSRGTVHGAMNSGQRIARQLI